jgi:hypothetical protein
VITFADITGSKNVEAGLRATQSEMATHSTKQGLSLDRALERLKIRDSGRPLRKGAGEATRKAPGTKREDGS